MTETKSTTLARSLRLARTQRRWHCRPLDWRGRQQGSEAAMTEKAEQARKTPRPTSTLERGINFDVLGRAIIEQADERIQWHKRAAGLMEAELKAMTVQPGAPASSAAEWPQRSRRDDSP